MTETQGDWVWLPHTATNCTIRELRDAAHSAQDVARRMQPGTFRNPRSMVSVPQHGCGSISIIINNISWAIEVKGLAPIIATPDGRVVAVKRCVTLPVAKIETVGIATLDHQASHLFDLLDSSANAVVFEQAAAWRAAQKYSVIFLVDPIAAVGAEDLYSYIGALDAATAGKASFYVPHRGYEQQFMDSVLAKAWTDGERSALQQTPGLLILKCHPTIFNPLRDRWAHLRFADLASKSGESGQIKKFFQTFMGWLNDDKNLFEAVEDWFLTQRRSAFMEAIEAKPGGFGVRVDLKKLVKMFGMK